uniref:Xyloglucanase A n=1 Tax=Rhizomucor miehei TaxID=4839 RepID=M9PJT0_RHIMI|nr:xyloglucanase A [Rhizomucor miehei]
MKISLLTTAAALLFATASTAIPLEKRADFCGQWDTAEEGPYTIYNNLWGQDSATSGQQCTGVDSLSGNTLAWHTSWTWAGGQYNVKSYANAALSFTATRVSDISSIPFTWHWSYTGSGIVANVAFDLWTSSSTSGNYEIEIMVWLGALGGAGPLGSAVGTFEQAGTTWTLYSGSNGSNAVYSFVAADSLTSISSDLLPFLKYLTSNGYISSSQYLRAVQAGTEPFVGTNAKLTTTAYSVSVN